MITKNGLSNGIERAINSVLSIADEIIVCDTGSTDGTLEWLQKHERIQPVQFKWTGDFSEARNASAEWASCDYFMWIDDDDELAEGHALINHLKSQPAEKAYQFYLKNIDAVKSAEITNGKYHEIAQIRMMPNHRGVKWEQRIHETPVRILEEKGIEVVKRCDVIVHHHGYKSEELVRNKITRNCRAFLEMRGFRPHAEGGWYEMHKWPYYGVYVPNVLAVTCRIGHMIIVDMFKDRMPKTEVEAKQIINDAFDTVIKEHRQRVSDDLGESEDIRKYMEEMLAEAA